MATTSMNTSWWRWNMNQSIISSIHLVKLKYFTKLDFPEMLGSHFPKPISYILGGNRLVSKDCPACHWENSSTSWKVLWNSPDEFAIFLSTSALHGQTLVFKRNMYIPPKNCRKSKSISWSNSNSFFGEEISLINFLPFIVASPFLANLSARYCVFNHTLLMRSLLKSIQGLSKSIMNLHSWWFSLRNTVPRTVRDGPYPRSSATPKDQKSNIQYISLGLYPMIL